jgi:hypothetical protein
VPVAHVDVGSNTSIRAVAGSAWPSTSARPQVTASPDRATGAAVDGCPVSFTPDTDTQHCG